MEGSQKVCLGMVLYRSRVKNWEFDKETFKISFF